MTAAASLVIGKFYPPHAGHVHLVRQALELRDRAVVLSLGSRGDTYSPERRRQALREDVEAAGIDLSRLQICAGWDETPYDLASETVWESHVRIFRAHLQSAWDVDLLVTSEGYGDELGQRLGLAHASVDPLRTTVPISASAVRADVPGAWWALGPGTRRMLAVRIVVLGAESTGTTTVATLLTERLRSRGDAWADTRWVPEYGHELTELKQRQAAAQSGEVPLSVDWTSSDFADVVDEQTRREDEALVAGGPVLVCDTDAFATPVWERRYLGDRASLDPTMLGRGDLYFLTDHNGVPFVQDGTRDGEHVRAQMTVDFERALVQHAKPWVLLSGSLEERVELAERAAEQVCRQRWAFRDPV